VDVKLCLIVIASNPIGFEDRLDGRVKSSLGSDVIKFDHYTSIELERILEYRVNEGFKPECVEDNFAQYVSWFHDTTFGDARKAIELLRISGEIANKRKAIVDFNVCREAREIWEKDVVYEQLDELPEKYLVILWYIAELCMINDKTSSGEVYRLSSEEPLNDVRGMPVSQVGERMMLEIITGLEVRGLVTTMNISMGRRGYGKIIRMNFSPQHVLSYVKAHS